MGVIDYIESNLDYDEKDSGHSYQKIGLRFVSRYDGDTSNLPIVVQALNRWKIKPDSFGLLWEAGGTVGVISVMGRPK